MNSIHHLQVIFSFSFQIPVYFAFDILIPDSFATVMVFFFYPFPFHFCCLISPFLCMKGWNQGPKATLA
jgi:hypothetical protein